MRQKLAAVQHEIWSHWMKYLFSVCQHEPAGVEVILPNEAERWKRQMNTPYSELTEKEKESDRDQADKVIAVLESK